MKTSLKVASVKKWTRENKLPKPIRNLSLCCNAPITKKPVFGYDGPNLTVKREDRLCSNPSCKRPFLNGYRTSLATGVPEGGIEVALGRVIGRK